MAPGQVTGREHGRAWQSMAEHGSNRSARQGCDEAKMRANRLGQKRREPRRLGVVR